MKKEEIERAASVKYPHPQIVDMQAAGHQGFVEGAEWAEQEMIEKACNVYANELKQIVDLLNKLGDNYGIDNLGEILSFEGCVKDFRKAMEE